MHINVGGLEGGLMDGTVLLLAEADMLHGDDATWT